MERFQRIFLKDTEEYVDGSGIIVCAQALLKDTVTNNIIGQVKYKNISNKKVKAIFVDVVCYDIAGRKLEGVCKHQYLDLNVGRDEFFGSQSAIKIINQDTRKVEIFIERVVYVDESVWEKKEFRVTVVPKLEKISNEFEIMEQAKIDIGTYAEFMYQEFADMWICTCGAINNIEEEKCHVCFTSKKVLESTSLDTLIKNKNKRLEELEKIKRLDEEKCIAEEKIAKEKRKKLIKIIIPILIVIMVIVGIVLTKPMRMIGKAEKLAENDNFEQAFTIIKEMKTTKKTKATYIKINDLFKSNIEELLVVDQVSEAVALLNSYPSYENYEDMLKEIRKRCSHKENTVEHENPTCTDDGFERMLCSSCGYEEEKQFEKLGHDYSVEVLVEITCTENGKEHGVCKNCGDEYEKIVEAKGHEWHEATCTSGEKCSVCNEEGKKALGHDWNSKGICQRCGEKKVENKPTTKYTMYLKETSIVISSDYYVDLIYDGPNYWGCTVSNSNPEVCSVDLVEWPNDTTMRYRVTPYQSGTAIVRIKSGDIGKTVTLYVTVNM